MQNVSNRASGNQGEKEIKMSATQIRTILRNAFGAYKYQINKKGEISVFGQMPNTNTTGWYLFGFLGNAETELRLKQL